MHQLLERNGIAVFVSPEAKCDCCVCQCGGSMASWLAPGRASSFRKALCDFQKFGKQKLSALRAEAFDKSNQSWLLENEQYSKKTVMIIDTVLWLGSGTGLFSFLCYRSPPRLFFDPHFLFYARIEKHPPFSNKRTAFKRRAKTNRCPVRASRSPS